MGLSVAIAGGIILSVLMLVMMSMAGLAGNIFSIGDVTTQVAEIEKSISETEISMNHVSTLIGSSTLNFTLSNDGQEKLLNFDEFDLFVTYDGAVSGSLTEEINYSGDCLGGIPAQGNWCIQSINGDMLDPGILNSAEGANIRVSVNENLANVNAIVSITTDNGITDTVMAPYCGPSCYQMSWHVVSDESQIDWAGDVGCGVGCIEELDQNDHWRTIRDLTDMTEWRFISFFEAPNGGVGCVITPQFSPDNLAPWSGLDNGLANSLSTTVNDCSVSQTYTVSPWSPLNITAQSDVWLRIVAEGPDTNSADIGTLEVQFRS